MLHYLEELFRALDFGSMQDALLQAAAVLLCLSVHETCHGLAAYALGDPTAKSEKRLSLNPLRHIDWFGFAMMFFAGFGWAKPVPVDARYFKKPKIGMAITALAGPLSNLLLSFLLLLGSKAIYLYAPYTATLEGLYFFLIQTAVLSLGLGLFNLIPIPPLDGSKIAAVVLPQRAYITLMRYERYGIMLLLLLSFMDIGGGLISRAIAVVFDVMVNLIY